MEKGAGLFYAIKRDGHKLQIHGSDRMREILNDINLPSGGYSIEIKKTKKTRSTQANRYYFLLVAMIRDRLIDLGHDVDSETTHEMLKGRLLYSEMIDENSGEIIKIPRSTKKLGTSEFMDYIEDVKRFSAEVLDLVLPDAGSQIEIDS